MNSSSEIGGNSNSMPPRRYYSMRKGTNPFAAGLDLSTLLGLFLDVYNQFERENCFQQALGFECVDAGYVSGTLGSDIGAQFRLNIRKDNLWPIQENCGQYTEDDLFDVIEFLHDNVAQPQKPYSHGWDDVCVHYESFDRAAGQADFRNSVNGFLRDYGESYELSADGEILTLAPEGVASLLDTNLPTSDYENVERRVADAIRKFRHRSTLDDRRDAIRDLADVLEYLHPQLRQVLTRKDESDLFNLANNFGIRHHNDQQKTDYDKAIWYSWMFYYYLATIHAAVRLIQKHEEGDASE